MKKLYLDTNVLLDFLLDRPPFTEDIAELLQKAIVESIKLCVSPISITDSYYIISKSEGKITAKKKILQILNLVSIENISESAIKKSAVSDFKDFEDGVQYYCAVEATHSIIVTRNVKDFKESDLAIMTPKEVLAKVKARL